MLLFAGSSAAAAVVTGPHAQTTAASVLQLVDELLVQYNCTSVYFDAASNIGVQIRKVYEPEWYRQHSDEAPSPACKDLRKSAIYWINT